jgi:hypothetical protein
VAPLESPDVFTPTETGPRCSGIEGRGNAGTGTVTQVPLPPVVPTGSGGTVMTGSVGRDPDGVVTGRLGTAGALPPTPVRGREGMEGRPDPVEPPSEAATLLSTGASADAAELGPLRLDAAEPLLGASVDTTGSEPAPDRGMRLPKFERVPVMSDTMPLSGVTTADRLAAEGAAGRARTPLRAPVKFPSISLRLAVMIWPPCGALPGGVVVTGGVEPAGGVVAGGLTEGPVRGAAPLSRGPGATAKVAVPLSRATLAEWDGAEDAARVAEAALWGW